MIWRSTKITNTSPNVLWIQASICRKALRLFKEAMAHCKLCTADKNLLGLATVSAREGNRLGNWSTTTRED